MTLASTDTVTERRHRPSPPEAVLELLDAEGDSLGRAYALIGEETVIGRGEDATVPVVSLFASRRHARIEGRGGAHVLVDLGSANGTAVNGNTVTQHELHDGDLVQIGGAVFRYRLDDGGWVRLRRGRGRTASQLVRTDRAGGPGAVPPEPRQKQTRRANR